MAIVVYENRTAPPRCIQCNPQWRRSADVKSRGEFGYLWILLLLYRVCVCGAMHLRDQFTPYLIGAWRTNIMMLSPALSPLTKRLPSLFHTAIIRRHTLCHFVYDRPVYWRGWRSDSLEGFCRNFFLRRRGVAAASSCWAREGRVVVAARSGCVVDKLSALWRCTWRSGLLPSPRPRDLFVAVWTTCRRLATSPMLGRAARPACLLNVSWRRQRNISKAADATLMKRVQRPFSEVISVIRLCRATVMQENVLFPRT